MCSRHPEVLWAQRSDKLYLTVSLTDAKDVSVKCEPHGLFTFTASKLQHESYSFTLELYGSIEPEATELISDDDGRFAGEDDESSDDEGMLYLPDLEKARGK
ncbi:hypothetical protein KIW84_012313 [Lathyrus oleraceus]|uniref:Co-chaperone protein p23 n=1 Tax=Pisum sativum TaxID=3888 RepID=A0A9D5BHH8_PEA|nr:hypothetical protein KIW84_012313 [Pisum sativum]